MLGKRHRIKAIQTSEQASEQIAAAALVLLKDLMRGNHSGGKSCDKYC